MADTPHRATKFNPRPEPGVINMIAIDPTTSNTAISEQCDASTTYVSYTRTRCRGIIHTRRKAAGAPPVDPTTAFRLRN